MEDGVRLLSLEPRVSDKREPAGVTRDELERQLFGAAFDRGVDPMMIVDGDYRIVAFNQASETLTGWRKDRTIGRHCWEVYSCHSSETTPQSRCSCPLAGKEEIFGSSSQRILTGKEGKEVGVSISHVPLPSQAHDDRYQFIVVHKASTPKGRTHVKQDVIAAACHELLSPLNLIRGYAATLSELGDTLAPEQRRRYLRGVESAVARATKLIRDFLDLPRLEAGKVHLAAEPTSLVRLVRGVVSEMQSQRLDPLIKLRAPRSVPTVNIDRGKIEQVMINLLSNAIKYSPRGHDIEVSIKAARDEKQLPAVPEKESLVKAPCLIVAVRDSGVGIPELEHELVFEKFYRVDNNLTRATSGVGIGLYISRVIVEAHGGHIWARSKLGEGSTFSFSLPVDHPSLKRQP